MCSNRSAKDPPTTNEKLGAKDLPESEVSQALQTAVRNSLSSAHETSADNDENVSDEVM